MYILYIKEQRARRFIKSPTYLIFYPWCVSFVKWASHSGLNSRENSAKISLFNRLAALISHYLFKQKCNNVKPKRTKSRRMLRTRRFHKSLKNRRKKKVTKSESADIITAQQRSNTCKLNQMSSRSHILKPEKGWNCMNYNWRVVNVQKKRWGSRRRLRVVSRFWKMKTTTRVNRSTRRHRYKRVKKFKIRRIRSPKRSKRSPKIWIKNKFKNSWESKSKVNLSKKSVCSNSSWTHLDRRTLFDK